jgi:hypothetical protein
MGAVVQDHRTAYELVIEPFGNTSLGMDKKERVTTIALNRQDASFVALGYSDGSVQVYSVDSGGVNIDLWMDARISATSIVALEFVPSSSTGSAGDGFILSMWP